MPQGSHPDGRERRRHQAAALVLQRVLIVFALACDIPPERVDPGGPVVLGTDPEEGEDGVDRAITARVFLDRTIVPTDVHRGNITLGSGEHGAFLAPRFDPVDRVLLLVNAGPALDPDVVYRAEIVGVRDLDLRAIEPFELSFETGEDAIGEPEVELPGFADVEPIFMRCADAGCHRGPDAVLGLDLSSGAAIAATAIGVPAEGARVGVEGDRAWHGAGGLEGLARIDVAAGMGRPAHSYLLYKVLGDPHVVGARMPPPPADALTPDELRTLADWILGGAPTD